MTNAIRRGIIVAMVYIGLAGMILLIAFLSATGEVKKEPINNNVWTDTAIMQPPENTPFAGYWVELDAPMIHAVTRYGNNYYLYNGKINTDTVILYNYPPIQWAQMPGASNVR
jgi:hypothetical protein